jgi:hypothetical protein
MTSKNAAPPPPPPSDDTSKPASDGPNSKPLTATVDTEAGTSVADSKGTDGLGQQVRPETQTREDDGNRTLANPVTDPGPVAPHGGMLVKHPDRSKGEHRYGDANEDVTVTMRTSTGHTDGYGKPAGDVLSDVKLPPDHFANGAASDVYNKDEGKSLTDKAQQNAAKPREIAPTHE